MKWSHPIFILGILSSLSQYVVAEKEISVSEFLATANYDYILESQDQKINYLKSSSDDISYIDDVQLRYRNEGLTRSRYSIRISPNGISATNAQKKLHESNYEYLKIQKSMLLNRALRKRYESIVDLFYCLAMSELNQDLEVVYHDRLTVLNKKRTEVNFDLNELIEAEEDLTNLKLTQLKWKSEISLIENKIKEGLPPDAKINFNRENVVDISFIKDQIKTNSTTFDSTNVYLKTRKLDLELSKNKYEYEDKRSGRFLDFISLGFDQAEWSDQIEDRDKNKEYDLYRSFFFQLGFNLPFLGSERSAISRRKINYLADQGRYNDEKTALQDEILQISEEIKTYLAQYEYVESRANIFNSDSSLNTYKQVDGIDPLILLRTKESSIKSEKRKEKIKSDVYLEYIKLMDIKGTMSQKPLKNLLSKKQEIIGDK